MSINLVLFRTVVAPEFAAMTDPEITAFGDEAEIELSEKAFGNRYPRAVCLITAHLIAMSKLKSASGAVNPLKRTKVGDLEREYAVSVEGQNDSFNLTPYGKEFVRLRRQVLMTPRFVSC